MTHYPANTEQESINGALLPPTDEQHVASYELLYITRAYNRKEITFEEWLRRSRAWAQAMINQDGKA